MKYVLAFVLAFGIGASAQAATPVAHSAIAAKSGVAAGVIKAADKKTKDTKPKKKKKKKKKASHA